MNCEETREHLEACEDCRLHVSVEARLRTQPVLDPPRGLVERVMKALPRAVPMRREVARLAAAAGILVALAVGAIAFKLDRHEQVQKIRPVVAKVLNDAKNTFNVGELWNRW